MAKKSFKDASAAAVQKFLNLSPSPTAEDAGELLVAEEQQLASAQALPIKTKSLGAEAPPLKEKYIDKYRMTLVIKQELKAYLDVITRLEGCSITQYINQLVEKDYKVRNDDYQIGVKLFKAKV